MDGIFLKIITWAVLSSNYVLYGDMSRRLMEILRKLSHAVEPYSIDEAFLPRISHNNIIEMIITHCALISEPIFRVKKDNMLTSLFPHLEVHFEYGRERAFH